MADISYGPVSTLPYSRGHALPEGAMCDSHPSRKAVVRIQGETDSFGCEYNDVCAECLKEIQDYRDSAEARTGMCEWCRKEATDLRDARDYDEGMAGRVYRVCGGCIKRRNEEAEEELWDSGYYDDCWDDDEDDECDEVACCEFDDTLPDEPQPKVIPMRCAKCGRKWEPKHQCRSKSQLLRVQRAWFKDQQSGTTVEIVISSDAQVDWLGVNELLIRGCSKPWLRVSEEVARKMLTEESSINQP